MYTIFSIFKQQDLLLTIFFYNKVNLDEADKAESDLVIDFFGF